MATLREWMHRMWGTVRRNARDREIEEELRSHLELAAEQMQAQGRAPKQAQRAVRLRYGGVAQAAESMRDQRGFPWLADLASDIRYALRMVGRNPGFAALAIATGARGCLSRLGSENMAAPHWPRYATASTVFVADELAGRPRLGPLWSRVEESPDFTEQGDC